MGATKNNRTNDQGSDKKAYSARLLNRLGVSTNSTVNYILEWVDVLVVAGLLAWLIMSFVTVRMTVPTGSMKPTIQPGDSFFVDKITYNFREPNIGDIIVFWHHDNNTTWRDDRNNQPVKGPRTRYVKRLVAKAGDTVAIRNGDVFLNGEKLSGPQFDRRYYPGPMAGRTVKVPPHHYLVLGDNSDNSLDSRYWGFVKASAFIGEPYLRVWPPSRFGLM